MTLWTWAEIKAKVKNDLDLNDEVMIGEAELLAYANEAIDEAEQHVLTIYEDYLLESSPISLVSGQSLYALPVDIYAHKIRRIFYNTAQDKYEVKRLRDLTKMLDVEANDPYQYMITNGAVDGAMLRLLPASREDSASNVEVWYLRNANKLVDDASVMDIPEAVNFVIAHIKKSCLTKEGHPGQVSAQQELERQRQLLVDTLSAMVPDEDNEVLVDVSFYSEFDCWQ